MDIAITMSSIWHNVCVYVRYMEHKFFNHTFSLAKVNPTSDLLAAYLQARMPLARWKANTRPTIGDSTSKAACQQCRDYSVAHKRF
jgi:hypothetical protein